MVRPCPCLVGIGRERVKGPVVRHSMIPGKWKRCDRCGQLWVWWLDTPRAVSLWRNWFRANDEERQAFEDYHNPKPAAVQARGGPTGTWLFRQTDPDPPRELPRSRRETPFRAFKGFDVGVADGRFALISPNQRTEWDGPKLTADEKPTGTVYGPGVYTYARIEDALARSAIVAEVELYGKVIEYERGFKGEHCVVQRLHYNSAHEPPSKLIHDLEARYGCPVLFDYRDQAAEREALENEADAINEGRYPWQTSDSPSASGTWTTSPASSLRDAYLHLLQNLGSAPSVSPNP